MQGCCWQCFIILVLFIFLLVEFHICFNLPGDGQISTMKTKKTEIHFPQISLNIKISIAHTQFVNLMKQQFQCYECFKCQLLEITVKVLTDQKYLAVLYSRKGQEDHFSKFMTHYISLCCISWLHVAYMHV